MRHPRTILPLLFFIAALFSACTSSKTLKAGDSVTLGNDFTNFTFSGEYLPGSAAGTIRFHDGGDGSGYEVVLRDGPIDGTIKTGSLAHVRNIYRTLADDGEWCPVEVSVRGKNISVNVKGKDVVCYTEPENPYRTDNYKKMKLGRGSISLSCSEGVLKWRKLHTEALADDAVNPYDTLPPVDESTDRAIRLQQEDFPVIDWHVHLKGGLTQEMAHAMSMNYGINYGVAPNAGEGGVGRMLRDDAEVYEYFNEIKDEPFLRGVQGEGRRWMTDFSEEALSTFDYLFTDAMTIYDHKGRLSRIYRNEEVLLDDITPQGYMEHLVNETVRILSNEPADFFANAFFLPDFLADDFDGMWTDERVARVLDVMQKEGIAMEISARYHIPSPRVVRLAKERGIKFTFGTNNVDSDFGRLEYSIDTALDCGFTPADLWFPTLSTRSARRQQK